MEYKGFQSIKSGIGGLGLRFGFPKTNLYSLLEVLFPAHALIPYGDTNEVVYFNLPYTENTNLSERGKVG